ncbi:MAG: hypothetical protein H7249_06290 [Chitinophagaceae bacterium]|nr:hypothetical protein [Oligoflexus sp.]
MRYDRLIGLAFLLTAKIASAQFESGALDTMQSSSRIHWKIITTPSVRVVFPDYLMGEGNEVANLIDHYSKVVGTSYDIKNPQQFTLVLRPETSSPNGFVTLAPRRSEWFSPNTVTPLIGSLNFYQALAIHEYRHVNQMDFFNQTTTRVIYWLFGESGEALVSGIGLYPWLFEGDAVWTETTYTDAGRGRSPRFMSRMKALVTSGQTPSYDAILAGTYNTNYPNHYVYGYLLVARAYRLFGPDIWPKIMARIAQIPVNPYELYVVFKQETGQDFITFYNETMAEAAKAWAVDFKGKTAQKVADYRDEDYPIVDAGHHYFLRKTLDTYRGLYRQDLEEKVPTLIKELPINPEMSRVDLKAQKLVYVQDLVDYRYELRGTSDLFVYDLKEDSVRRLTHKRRLYNPQISPDHKSVLTIEETPLSTWAVTLFDWQGDVIKTLSFAGHTIDEAIWKDATTLYAIARDPQGYKSIVEINLDTKTEMQLLGPTRNNIFALNASEDTLSFEADWKGAVQIFRLDPRSKALAQCTQEPIAAYRPFVDHAELLYVAEDANGTQVRRTRAQCTPVAPESLVAFRFLGDTPSDNFQKIPPTVLPLPAFNQTIAEPHESEDYAELDGGFKPHTWHFFAGRGAELSATTQNYLNTFGLFAAVGEDSEEKRPYANLRLDYRKYVPVFSLLGGYEERSLKRDFNQPRQNWTDNHAAFMVSVPYSFDLGFYHGSHLVSGSIGYLHSSDIVHNRTFETGETSRDDIMRTSSAEYHFELTKQLKPRELTPALGLGLDYSYRNAAALKVKDDSTWQQYARSRFYLPGFLLNNTMSMAFSMEEQKSGDNHYRSKSYADSVETNVFSRGYDFVDADRYQKVSYEYNAPLAYPDANAWGWAFLKRISSTLFFDYTHADFMRKGAELKSAGAEFKFDVLLLRKLDINLGLRITEKLSEDKGIKGEGFLATKAGF